MEGNQEALAIDTKQWKYAMYEWRYYRNKTVFQMVWGYDDPSCGAMVLPNPDYYDYFLSCAHVLMVP